MAVLRALYNISYSTFFRPEKFYCQLELGEGMIFKIWERPGGWLSEQKLQKMIKDIHAVAVAGQNSKDVPEYGVLRGDKEDLKNRVITIGYEKKTGKPVAFAAQIYLDVPLGLNVIEVLHLGLVYVDKEYRKKWIPGMLYILPNILLLLKHGFRPIWISNVTQVPSVVGLVADYYEKVYPDPIHQTKQALMQKSLSEGILKYHRSAFGTGADAEFNEEKQVIYNSYTGGSDNLKKSYEECQKYRDEKVNSFCRENLDYNRGDDFLQIGTLSGKIIHNFFSKRVQGVSNIQWFLYLLVAGIFITLLPILKWLTRKGKGNE